MIAPQVLADRFDVHDPIGRGGMGVVVKGRDRQTGRDVAIKTLRTDVLRRDPAALERFTREAAVLRQLDHPNIIKVLATIEQDGATYIVMEYAGGGSLAAALAREGPMPIDRILPLALDVADAMTRVHRLSILHRDLKPENILLADDGSAKLSDFGIAYFTGADALTQEGGVFGTTHYLSPEVLCGQPFDARADVWAFGVVLFEMLAGRPPFAGDLVATIIQAILNAPVPDLEALRPDAPVALVDLVYRMLDKDMRTRIRSVRLVGVELEALVHHSADGQTMFVGVDAKHEAPRRRPAPFTPGATTTLKATPNNLPAQTTPFVGRQDEMRELARLVDDPGTRLITVLGSGGSGKTRIALELGGQELARFRDGVFLVSLAPLRDTDAIVTAAGDAIGLAFTPGVPHRHQLLMHVAERQVLMIFDNFEHLLDGAGLTAEILSASPHVRIVVTSRERLGLQDETIFRLDGLDVPDAGAPREVLRANAAVELFLQSARRAWPSYLPAGGDWVSIAGICQTVGGSPLAILLAGSWVETLGTAEILGEIRRSLDFLETDQRHVEARHRSMRVVFDASWQRLETEPRQAFARMAVFRGGFAREAAQEVAGASLRALSILVRQSLLRRDPDSGRYDMHELLRQYAEGRLAEMPGEADGTAARHAAHYAAFLHGLEPRLYGLDKTKALVQVEREIDNVRAAWDWSVEHASLAAIGQALTSLAAFYGLRTLNEEAVARFGPALRVVRALPDGERPLELELGLQVRSTVSLMNLKGYGDPDVGAGFTRAHELCDRLGPSRLIAPVMFGLWAFYMISAAHGRASKLAEQLLTIGDSGGDPVLMIGGHHSSAGSAAAAGRFGDVVRHAERVIELYKPEYDPFIVTFFADHSASASRGWHGVALTVMGFLDRAREVRRAMRAFFEQLGHGQTHAQGLMFLVLHASLRRDVGDTIALARELKQVGERYGLPVYSLLGDCFLAGQTATPAEIPQLTQASATIRDVVGFKCVTLGLAGLRQGELELASGDAAAALATAEAALAWIRGCEEHLFESEAHRLRGDAQRAMGDGASAETSYQTAIDIAHGQQARLFELRATVARARLWRSQGRAVDAHVSVRALYDWFSEGFDAADLREARELIEALGRESET